ncbi:hypothetical protein SynMVIR181_02932 [Synechococcus sp. MVIR-18-1]|nr:hypothetical protein SynMVIR181_02932 [Synechococcus sp. MVIR-18-1]
MVQQAQDICCIKCHQSDSHQSFVMPNAWTDNQKHSNTDNQKAKSKENHLLALNFIFLP